MRLIVSICMVMFLLVSCGGDKKNTDSSANKKSASAKNIELTPGSSDDTKSESTASNDTSADASTSPPMTKEQLSQAKDLLKKTSKAKVKAVKASTVFKMRCSSCHGFNGKMMVNGAKDLTASKVSLEESVAQVYFGKGLMTPFKGMMKDEEIIAVCKYIEDEFMK